MVVEYSWMLCAARSHYLDKTTFGQSKVFFLAIPNYESGFFSFRPWWTSFCLYVRSVEVHLYCKAFYLPCSGIWYKHFHIYMIIMIMIMVMMIILMMFLSMLKPISRSNSWKQKRPTAFCETLKFSTILYCTVLFTILYQSSIKCCSAAAPLRAEQGPCEPSEDVVRKFGEQ